MTETKTVELPLTKSEQNHLDNIRRRDAKRRNSEKRDADKQERDGKLRAIRAEADTKIAAIRKQQALDCSVVWKEWQDKRSKSE